MLNKQKQNEMNSYFVNNYDVAWISSIHSLVKTCWRTPIAQHLQTVTVDAYSLQKPFVTFLYIVHENRRLGAATTFR